MHKEHSGRTVSVWMATQAVPEFPTLGRELNADVCVVGAGIAGLTTAYLLIREGRNVVVLDAGPILSGETERTTAHLASALDDGFSELEKTHGEHGAVLAAQCHAAAIDAIESILTTEEIDCDFTRLDGYLFAGMAQSTRILDRELVAARRAGLSVEMLPRAPIEKFDTGRALRFGNQAQFHPLKYLTALAKAIVRHGGKIFTHTQVIKVEEDPSPRVHTAEGLVVTAKSIVVATNTPVNDKVTMHTKQAPYRTYVIGVKVPSGSVFPAMYWDTEDPYHYVRLETVWESAESPTGEMLIVGGEDHKTGQVVHPEERFDRLEAWTRERFYVEKVVHRWSGQVMEPVDSLAFIGRNPGQENIYIATGDSGHGMTHGTIAGMLLRDLITDRANPWEKLYDPSRKPIRSLGEFARENLNVAGQYRQYVTGGDPVDEQHMTPDTGAVVRRGGKKVAVYCDAEGHHHECSAVFPHLGCLVSWNSVEKTWDCPCHGSRFDSYGEVVNGPANEGLEKLEPHSRPEPVRAGD
jgi:glycine/D-amino acid oxidase-like deaminating enzyme/nitrite reductase/ring-hydroxylating ferredoxin subunit